MTVRSANYSSLEEVWGESYNSSSKGKKEKRKKIVDPICDLYQMGNNNGYNDNDLVSYANNYFERYDKTPYQRSMNNNIIVHEDDDTPKHHMRERPVREVVVSNDKQKYDVSEYDDVSENQQPLEQEHQVPIHYPSKSSSKEKFSSRFVNVDDDDEPDNGVTSFALIDLLLYIISGIILIFVMEQFVKIGLLLQ